MIIILVLSNKNQYYSYYLSNNFNRSWAVNVPTDDIPSVFFFNILAKALSLLGSFELNEDGLVLFFGTFWGPLFTATEMLSPAVGSRLRFFRLLLVTLTGGAVSSFREVKAAETDLDVVPPLSVMTRVL